MLTQAASSDALSARVCALALHAPTPLYIYDLPALRRRVADVRKAFAAADATLFFATMANDRARILESLAAMGVGACVNSIPHLELAQQVGFPVQSIQFTSTGITQHDMRQLLVLGVHPNLDSLSQLAEWFQIGGRVAGVRINAASLGCGLRADRIGVDSGQIADALALADRFGGRITGLHVYLGTNFQQADQMIPSLERLFELAGGVPSLEYVNVGGGIGIDYQRIGSGFDLETLGAAVARSAARLQARAHRRIEVIVEPGRGLVAECGTFVTSVTDVKMLNGQRFAAVDGSIAVFPRPLHHPDTPHRVRCLSSLARGDGSPALATTVVGRTTFSRDVLVCAPLPADLRLGDILALDDAGAYSQSMASRFLGQPDPEVIYLDD